MSSNPGTSTGLHPTQDEDDVEDAVWESYMNYDDHQLQHMLEGNIVQMSHHGQLPGPLGTFNSAPAPPCVAAGLGPPPATPSPARVGPDLASVSPAQPRLFHPDLLAMAAVPSPEQQLAVSIPAQEVLQGQGEYIPPGISHPYVGGAMEDELTDGIPLG